MWILYDGRASLGRGTDRAAVLVACDSKAEARGSVRGYGASACYSYAVKGRDVLADERWEWDWSPEIGFVGVNREKGGAQ
jgi:hypothetical protein